MRNRLMVSTAALLLASVAFANAETRQTPGEGGGFEPTLGVIDFGVRGTTTDGDEARYERYRDTRSGAFSRIVFGKETEKYVFDFNASNIGYHDQRYTAGYANGRVSASFLWDSTPLNFGYYTSTPWVEDRPGVLTLNPTVRAAVQSRQPGVLGIPTNAAQLNGASVYRSLSGGLDLVTRRDTATGGLEFIASREVDVDITFSTATKTGYQPWGAAFAFNNANEVPLQLDNRTNDVTAGVEWAKPKGMMRLAWTGSWFSNDIQELVWDNPIRATDTNPVDPSGYSNGNGPARGRMALAPSNTMNVVSALGLIKLPGRSTINGNLAYTDMSQNEALIPWTINQVIGEDVFHYTRQTAEAQVRGINAALNFTSRPTRFVSFSGRYRYNKHDNRTPEFDAVEYVRFDAVPEEVGGHTHQYDISRQTLDLGTTVSLRRAGSVRLGYLHDASERHGRGFSDTAENTVRLSYDAISLGYLSVRAGVDYGQRRGEGYILAGQDYEIGPAGEQPGLRYYDEADRNRTRGTVVVTVSPVSMASLFLTYAGGRDEYLADDSVPAGREQMGLLDNSNTAYTVGLSLMPRENVAFGANYGREKYSAFQKSRNANPPPDPTWTNPARNWTIDNDETVTNFDVYLDLLKAIARTDVRLAYDYSDSDNGFTYGGPRIDSLRAAGQFVALPNVTNKWQRLTADVQYLLTARMGVGVGYWYEKFDVNDWATINLPGTQEPRIDYLGGLITGYGNRPYEGNTAFVRLLYMF